MPLLYDRKIFGGPGSGKSTSTAKEISLLTDIQPHEILCVMFNREARSTFLEKLRSANINGAHVRTFHSLAYKLIQDYAQTPSRPPINVARAVAAHLLENNPEPNNVFFQMEYKLIFVDEAQDLTETDVAMIQQIIRRTNAKIWLAADIPQAINMFQGSKAKYFVEWPVEQETVLDKSHRCTPEILNVVNALRTDTTHMKSHKPPGGHRPVLFSGNDVEIRQFMHAALKDIDLEVVRVGIVGPVKKFTKTNVGLNAVEVWLQSWKIPYQRHYEYSTSDSTDVRAQKRTRESASVVGLHTVHSCKGLTFDVCLHMDMHEYARGTIDTAEKEIEIRNLFHVGTSRAAGTLYLLHRKSTLVLRDLWACWDDITTTIECPKPRVLKATHPTNRLTAWTEFLTKADLATESVLLALQEAWDVKWECLQEGTVVEEDFDEELAPVMGVFAENVLEHAYTHEMPACMRHIQAMVSNVIDLPEELSLHALGDIWTEASLHLVQADVLRKKLQMKGGYQQLVDRLCSMGPTVVYVHDKRVITQFFDIVFLEELVGKPTYNAGDIWNASLFLFQYKAQALLLWNKHKDFAVGQLSLIWDNLIEVAATLPEGMVFQKDVKWQRMGLGGIIDMYHPPSRTIYELKFSKNPVENNLQHALQVLGYREMLGKRNVAEYSCEVWNLRTMERCLVTATTCKRKRWQVEEILLEALQRKLANPIFGYDLETQGLMHQEYSDIVEVHLEDYETGVCPLSTLVYQPFMPARTSAINHINAIDLVGMPTIQDITAILEKLLVERCDRPCMVAYNGARFDDKIMRRDIDINWSDVAFKDALVLVKAAVPSRPPSFKLGIVYETYVGREIPAGVHRAEADVDMMIEALYALNVSPQMFT